MAKDPTVPTLSLSIENKIDLVIPKTQALLQNQGYTYNQATFTYNQAGVSYGGIYNFNQDLLPLSLSFNTEAPHISGIIDTGAVTGYGPVSVGPGFFLYITMP